MTLRIRRILQRATTLCIRQHATVDLGLGLDLAIVDEAVRIARHHARAFVEVTRTSRCADGSYYPSNMAGTVVTFRGRRGAILAVRPLSASEIAASVEG